MKLDNLLEQITKSQKKADASKSIAESEETAKSMEILNSQSAGDAIEGRSRLDDIFRFLPVQQNENQKEQQRQKQGTGDEAGGQGAHQQIAVITAFLKANPLLNLASLVNSNSSRAPVPTPTSNHSSAISHPPVSIPNPPVVPFSQNMASQGLLAVGGCRQCSKTFADRLSLIHHFVDHFPNIFYSFEERPTAQTNLPQETAMSKKSGRERTKQTNGIGTESGGGNSTAGGQLDFLGQLAGLFALTGGLPPSNHHSSSFSSASNPTLNPQTSMTFSQAPNNAGDLFAASLFANNLAKPRNMASNGDPSADVQHCSRTNSGPAKGGNENGAEGNLHRTTYSDLKGTSGAGSRKRHGQRESNSPRNGANSCGKAESQRQKVGQQQTGNNNKRGTNGTALAAGNAPPLSELPYHMCPHCCLTFAETSAFKAHLAVHENELNHSTGIPASLAPFMGLPPLSTENASFKCALCEMKFSNAFRLNEHLRLHSAHTCETCQKTFMTAFDLNLHMGTHSGFTYDCKDCGRCFPCRKTLAEHNRSHRMILSGGRSASPEPAALASKKANLNNQQEVENAPYGTFEHQQQNENGRAEKRKLRAPKRGEKSRRNATLVALESTNDAGGPPAPAIQQMGGIPALTGPMLEAARGLPPLMGQLLASTLAAEQQQKIGTQQNDGLSEQQSEISLADEVDMEEYKRTVEY